jgi:hypothetical protein
MRALAILMLGWATTPTSIGAAPRSTCAMPTGTCAARSGGPDLAVGSDCVLVLCAVARLQLAAVVMVALALTS